MEAKYFYGFQAMMENIHAETYDILLETFLPSNVDKTNFLDHALQLTTVGLKNAWAKRWMDVDGRTFSERLVAFACVEGIFFSSSFAIVFWFKSRGLHTQFACELLRLFDEKPPQWVVHTIVAEAADIEVCFAKESLHEPLPGVSAQDMLYHVRFIADQLLQALGYQPLFHVENPFPFMMMISMPSRVNFFERQNSEYRKVRVNHGAVADEEFDYAIASGIVPTPFPTSICEAF
ncbi:ferritin-like protein [Coprinellus micaceus]|uniref:Ferritin-like protein n=1 Tax=Coprinellus micaceus TaxID=71717 RepID=A0A4Y7SF53_COPMI|nr:ferritin-like protein [Coprinellus micaceus]